MGNGLKKQLQKSYMPRQVGVSALYSGGNSLYNYDKGNTKRRDGHMAQYPSGKQGSGGLESWILIILALIFFAPLGLFLLFRKLAGPTGSGGQRARHPYDIRREEAGQPPSRATGAARSRQASGQKQAALRMPSGKGLIVGGTVLAAVFALGALSILTDTLAKGTWLLSLTPIFATMVFFGAGLVMIASGIGLSRKAKRFRKYLALIGRRERIAVEKLAMAMPVSKGRATDDLQEMLDKGYIPHGYLDYASSMLVLSGEGLQDDEPEKKQPEPAPAGMEREDEILREIREVNDCIRNPELSRKIDRVGEVTGRIFSYLRENPDKENRLRGFLNYYLPTTLKILRAYAQMEAQGIEGENITAAMGRIEGMMDKVADGFERQLDMLFQDQVLDVTSDVAVLEQMLRNDGLSAGEMGRG